MAKLIRKIELDSDTLALSECRDGFWLWDETRKLNLAMSARTERAALVEALQYYQDRLLEVESERNMLSERVEKTLAILAPEQNETGE